MSNGKKKEIQEKSGSFKEDLTSYFKGVRSEWGKITWPEKNQVVSQTISVLVIVTFFTILVFLMDLLFKHVFFNWLLQLFSNK